MALRAGDVVVVNFPGATGVKRRPALVLSSAEYHAARPDVVVGLITSQTSAALGPTDCGLQVTSPSVTGPVSASVSRTRWISRRPVRLQSPSLRHRRQGKPERWFTIG